MSKGNSVRPSGATATEQWARLWRRYQSEHPGAFRVEDFVDWTLENNLADLPKVNPKRLLIRKARQATRAARIQDAQGRTVRELLPAKIPIKVDENGQTLLFEVQYDNLHTMSLDHALLAFDQRDDNIRRQKQLATRDLQSFLDNNPNAQGREHQFVFDFVHEESQAQQVEVVHDTWEAPKHG
jgi:hypothetical protein